MSELTPLTGEALNTLRSEFDADGTSRLAMNAVTAAGIDKVARNYDRARLLQRRFSATVDNGEATHQDRSGRCWLFSSLNVMGDGGQWTMAMNVYKKYGAVPKDLFPETESSKNTGEMNTQLRHLLHTAVAHMYAAEGDTAKVEQIIAETTAAGHRILTIHLGEPPVSFDWEWTDADGEFHRDGEITPVEFWKKYVGPAGLEDYVCLVDDPRAEHAKGKKIGIEHLGNVAGGDATEYLNVPNQFMKDCVKQILVEQGIPVWFGADCHPFMDRESGAWATDLFEYGKVYDVDFDLDKEARVRFGDSAMNHAMAFAGVDVADDGATRRWRVENSWGAKIADKGYFTMSDDWFTEYVYEVAVPKSMLPAEYQKALEEPATMLPAWDPMGALAK